ncbi:MAG TPA: hypothetical protein VEC35_09675 [Noviherbaspirillum sp.]|nr:hypothetical protein [Noviherbaspirillum sp.]
MASSFCNGKLTVSLFNNKGATAMKEPRKVEEYEGKDADRERTFHGLEPSSAGPQQGDPMISDELLEVFKVSKQALTTAWEKSRVDKGSLL